MNYEAKFEKIKAEPKWVLPNFTSEEEKGELERVARTFSPENPEEFVKRFYEQVDNLEVVTLTEELLAELDNTNARDVDEGDFEEVEVIVIKNAEGNTEHIRDWRKLKDRMEKGEELDAPVIIKLSNSEGGTIYHKMSGNTRLMVAKALGIYPKVAVVDLTEL